MPSELAASSGYRALLYYTGSNRGVRRGLVGRGSTHCTAVRRVGRRGEVFPQPRRLFRERDGGDAPSPLPRVALPSPLAQCRCHRLRRWLYFDCARPALRAREPPMRY